MKRHSNALAIQEGACNPHGIVNSLGEALKECREEGLDTQSTCHDPAIRLIVHQLAFLCGAHEIDNGMSLYGRLIAECEENAKCEEKRRNSNG